MTELRLATSKDFEVYKTLYHKIEFSMLYQPDKSDIKPQISDENQKWKIDSETLKQIEEELTPTLEKFKKKITNLAEHRIYIIEEGENVFGFAELFKIVKTRWKLAELTVKENSSSAIVKTITDMLIIQSRIRVIDVCVPIYPSCEKRLEESGFYPIGGGFFRKERQKS